MAFLPSSTFLLTSLEHLSYYCLLPTRAPPRLPQAVSEFASAQRLKKAAKERGKLSPTALAELKAADQVDASEVLPEGTRRQAYKATMEEIEDFEEAPLQEWLDGASSSDESYHEGGEGDGDGDGRGAEGDDDDEDEDDEGDDDDDDYREVSDWDGDDSDEEEEEAEGGEAGGEGVAGSAGPRKRRKPSKREAAKVGKATIQKVIAAATSAGATSAGAASAGASSAGADGDAVAAGGLPPCEGFTDEHREEAERLGYTTAMRPGQDEDEDDEDWAEGGDKEGDSSAGGSSSSDSDDSGDDFGESKKPVSKRARKK